MHSASADRLSRACTAIAAVALVALSTSDRRLLAQAAPTLTATPLTIAAGGMAAVSVANGPGNTTDWVGLYAASASDFTMIDWKYLNGTRTTPATALTSATVTFTVPSTVGLYNTRLFSHDTYTKVA